MLEWFEKITDKFCEEQVMEERVSVESIEKRFDTDLIQQFLCSLPTLFFKFLIDKGGVHIVEPRPSLRELPPNSNWVEKQKKWEKLIFEREWEYFLSK